jgi:hypothetical protein
MPYVIPKAGFCSLVIASDVNVLLSNSIQMILVLSSLFYFHRKQLGAQKIRTSREDRSE